MFESRDNLKRAGEASPETTASRSRAFDELIRRHAREIQLFLCKLCGNHHDAEELAQDVFVKAYRKLDHLRAPAATRRWLFTIAVNHFSDWIKPRAQAIRRASLSLEAVDLPGRARRPEEDAMVGELSGFLKDAVVELPERQRTVLLLFAATGFDYVEIGSALGISPDAVKMSLFHAREKLRAKLDRYMKR